MSRRTMIEQLTTLYAVNGNDSKRRLVRWMAQGASTAQIKNATGWSVAFLADRLREIGRDVAAIRRLERS